MVVGSRPRAEGKKASLEPLLSPLPECDFLPFRPSLSCLLFLLSFKDLRQFRKKLKTDREKDDLGKKTCQVGGKFISELPGSQNKEGNILSNENGINPLLLPALLVSSLEL